MGRRSPTGTGLPETTHAHEVRLEVRLLGSIELRIDGRPVALGGPRQRALLAILAMRPGQVVAADELIDEVWSGARPDGADTTLRSYVSRLRQSLGGAASIDRTDRGYVLRTAPELVDALEFERLVRDGRASLARGGTRRARKDLADALALWRGRPFGDVGAEGVLGSAIARLEELRLLATEDRIDADLALGRAPELVDELEGLLREQPFRERLWQQLMLALYRVGRQADALAAYHRARRALDAELGIEPGPALRELESAILRQDVPSVARTEAHDNLPSSLTTFVGREAEIDAVAALLERHRLVTLTGVGGVGKTRLALEAGRRSGDEFPDGIWFVDLAPLADPELVVSNVATTLGVRVQGEGSPMEGFRSQLTDRRLLLVLDNCEHLRDAAAELAQAVLQGTSDVHLLATSRVALGVPSEVDYAVPPLALPDEEAGADPADPSLPSEAAGLFLERARAARPNLPADPETVAAIERIVADLDGLPLAIELAAARAKAFTVADISMRLSDRFRFLVSWRRLASARHRTLAEAMAWSFDLLDPEEQALLAGLSVFAGSFDLASVASVCLDGDLPRAQDLVQRLVDASLVTLDPAARGASRYRLLETVRQYATERLAESGRQDDVRGAHARHFADLADAVPTTTSGQAGAVARLDIERENLRAAIEHSVSLGDRELQRRMTSRLWSYWLLRGFLGEARARLDATLEHGPAIGPEHYPRALLGAGNVAWATGRYADGKRYGHELLELGRSSGSVPFEHAANQLLSSIALREGDFETSERHSLRMVELAGRLDDPIRATMSFLNHAVLVMDMGRIETAVPMLEDALERFRASDHGEGVGLALLNLGEAAFLLGNTDDAHRRFFEARDAFESVGFRAHVGHAMQGLAAVEARDGDPAVAADLLGRAAAVHSELGVSPDFNPGIVAGAAEAARAALGETEYADAYDAGWAAERRRPRR